MFQFSSLYLTFTNLSFSAHGIISPSKIKEFSSGCIKIRFHILNFSSDSKFSDDSSKFWCKVVLLLPSNSLIISSLYSFISVAFFRTTSTCFSQFFDTIHTQNDFVSVVYDEVFVKCDKSHGKNKKIENKILFLK